MRTRHQRQGCLDTNLCRMVGVWETRNDIATDTPLVEVRGLNHVVTSNKRLRISPDIDVLAWMIERWRTTDPRDPLGKARFTYWDLATDLYRIKEPDGWCYDQIDWSIGRLLGIWVELRGWSGEEGRPVEEIATREHLLVRQEYRWKELKLRREDQAGMRGWTTMVQIAPWLRFAIEGGGCTYLNWSTLRALKRNATAKRLWVHLEAENYERSMGGKNETVIWLGAPALATLGVGGYRRHVDARRALQRAAKKVMKADPRYEIALARLGRGSWQLRAHKRPAREVEDRLKVTRLARASHAQAARDREAA